MDRLLAVSGLVWHWCRSSGLQEQDGADVAQDVFGARRQPAEHVPPPARRQLPRLAPRHHPQQDPRPAPPPPRQPPGAGGGEG
ncbi:MAG: hypothetical protein U0797_26590 [Gemmataceae bacterium]